MAQTQESLIQAQEYLKQDTVFDNGIETFIETHGLCYHRKGVTLAYSTERTKRIQKNELSRLAYMFNMDTYGSDISKHKTEDLILAALIVFCRDTQEDPAGDEKVFYEPAELIEYATSHFGLKVSEDGEMHYIKGESVDQARYVHHILAGQRRYRSNLQKKGIPSSEIPNFSKMDIEAEIGVMAQDKGHKKRQALRDAYKFQGEGWTAWVDSTLDLIIERWQVRGNKVLAREMMKQSIWQLKRYMNNLDVDDHFFVNIFGRNQGTGKTTFWDKIGQVVKDYYISTATVQELSDERFRFRLLQNYFVLFDEMSFSSKDSDKASDIAAVKAVVSSQDVTYRTLGQNSDRKGRRKACLVGTSNRSITEVIRDNTGYRRFFEIQIDCPSHDEPFLEYLHENVDFENFFYGIDESLPNGYIPRGSEILQELRNAQKKYKHTESIDHVLEAMSQDLIVIPLAELSSDSGASTEAGEAFKEVIRRQGLGKINIDKMREWLDERGFDMLPHIDLLQKFDDVEGVTDHMRKTTPKTIDSLERALRDRNLCTFQVENPETKREKFYSLVKNVEIEPTVIQGV